MATAMTPSYWLDIPLLEGTHAKPRDGGIVVIGSGLSGVSSAYWLLQNGFDDITVVDFESPKAASFRNCGHILYGTVESMHAMVDLHGKDIARDIWQYSIDICHEVRDTVARHDLDADYKQEGYLVIAIDETEDKEIHHSIDLLNSMDFKSSYVAKSKLEKLGFRNTFGGRFEEGSAQAHPVKFRNELLRYCLSKGVRYHSGVNVSAVHEVDGRVELASNFGTSTFDACVIAANAYSPLLSDFFAKHRLVEPFRGQIITSEPLSHDFTIKYPHSFDHGYEYAIVTGDNRLMIGGWRNHTEGGEKNTYDIVPNPFVVQGLQDFVSRHYAIDEKVVWSHSWSGIMAASRTGFPFIGPTDSQLIFTVSGYTGHGFSWAHGSAKLLADIMAGNETPAVAKYFNPRAF